jgi:hypothetical protein
MRNSRKTGVPQPRSGAVYSIFSNSQPSASTLDHTGAVTNSQTSTPLDALGTHGSRFAPSESPGVEVVSLPEQGSSRDDAILISSSPVRPIRAPRTFRAERVRKTHAGSANDHDSMPYPSDTHIRGTQHDFSYPRVTPFSRRLRHPHSPADGSTVPSLSSPEDQRSSAYHAMPAFHHEVVQEATAEDTASYAPSDMAIEELRRDSCRHPAIERLLDSIGQPPMENAAEELIWCEKWRPSAANQVLGNESSARYLRDWLATLQLGQASFSSTSESTGSTTKRKRQPAVPSKPVVVRAVDRAGRRKRAKLDSDDEEDMRWIVEGEESDQAMEDDVADDELLLRGQRQATPIINNDTRMEPEVERISFEILTNTILISGPTGVGKTAAVFACAAELGYEVFEVYPGIGRRSGAELDRLIGDVGKNHLVNKTEAAPRANQSKPINGITNSIFGTSARKSPGISTLEATDTNRLTSSHEEGYQTSVPSVGQSIVLLEEVDILFKDDTNFWPIVVNIIKECRRPVVLTCNGTFPRVQSGMVN